MFFTPELLSKRDSGFGLLWLAATLGSRSNFKKLPKRSVLTADIAQLCDLISEPAEPLALRLSSNLMFGVVRVYKVKQEIFLSDVTNCVASLKKVVQDLRSSGALDGQIQMANPTARPSALTIVPDPKAAYVLDFDAFVADWDEYLNIGADTTRGSDDIIEAADDDFNPNEKKKTRAKANAKMAPPVEAMRKEAHTLEEHHEHLLSASFDLSFHNHSGHGGLDPSSSQAEAVFDNFFAFSDGLDLGDGLGDDLARELGWGVSPAKSANHERNQHEGAIGLDFNHDDNFNMDFSFNADNLQAMDEGPNHEGTQTLGTPISRKAAKKTKSTQQSKSLFVSACSLLADTQRADNYQDLRMGSVELQARESSPAASFSRLLLTQDLEQPQPFRDITNDVVNEASTRKHKRTRLLLDARTELTDDELKIARAKYLESQHILRQELLIKRLQKDNNKVIEDLIWGVPQGIQAPGLINFWQENFKVQIDARSGGLSIHEENERPAKRRKNNHIGDLDADNNIEDGYQPVQEMDWAMDNWDTGNNQMDLGMAVDDTGGNRHSSEEPGQARRISRSASVLGGNFGFDLGPRDQANGSQRSSLFPWDNAGPSSSTGREGFPLADGDPPIEHVEIALRSRSPSRRGTSPLAPSMRGSIGIQFSPAEGGRNSQAFGEDFVFDIENAAIPEDTQQETQKSDMNLITLERNSFNFLEYAKMQYQTLSKPDGRLTFETVAPQSTSTRHVAASAFYHCLVLATKSLLSLKQADPYGSVVIGII